MKTNVKISLSLAALVLIISGCSSQNNDNKTEKEQLPNIVIIYLDDLGYGDVGANGATEISTPNIDQLANEGLRFTDAHATSATCTPSRYAILTGTYPWRNTSAKILPGTAPLVIDSKQMTIARMLKKKDYQTGIVGKWHLGLGDGYVDWNKPISPGPKELGFDYSYIMAATQDRVPTVYIENGLVVGLDPEDPILIDYEKNYDNQPTGLNNPELLTMKWDHGHNNTIINGIPRIGFMKGGEAARWNDVDMADHFLGKAKEYVEAHKDAPFFLYYAMQQPHVPRTPHPRFAGTSGMGPRGDVILEADWCIGEFMKTLEEEGLLENTLVIFSSDNGPVINDGYDDEAVEKLGEHKPWGEFRGGKYSLFEAGTRVPFIVSWKGKIDPGISDALVCQIDLLSSLAELVRCRVKVEDSKDLLDVFMGKSDEGRDHLILEATSRTALRKGDWIMIPPYEGPAVNKYVDIELGNADKYQLYNLAEDIGEQKNLAEENTEKLMEMINSFRNIRGENIEVEQLQLR